MMKLHRSLAEAVVESVDQIMNTGRKADRVIEYMLKSNRKWGARDRGFIAGNTYEMVRWWRLLGFAADAETDEGRTRIWKAFAALLLKQGNELPGWKEFAGLDPGTVLKKLNSSGLERKIRESVPDWMDETGVAELGIRWDSELHALNQPARLILRVNRLKTDRRSLQRQFDTKGIETSAIEDLPDALVVEKRVNLFTMEEFRKGLFEVQDGSSQLIAPYLQVSPGMRVVDACAGAGGKSLHLAALMGNKGRIISMDTEQWKLDELMRRAKRAGVSNIETRLIDSTKVVKRLHGTADRLLLDVPCSGLGVLRRNPDAKWKLQPEFLERIRETQHEIITKYAAMVRPGGMMVYATCSILPSENEKQVARFLSSDKGFRLVSQAQVSSTQGFDGFYMALLHKSEVYTTD